MATRSNVRCRWIVLVAAAWTADGVAARTAPPTLTKAERIVAIRGQGYFPVMIKLGDGSLGAVVRGGAPHVGLGGRIDFIRSGDGGRTWSKPVVAIDSPWDDRNPAFGQMRDGTLVLIYAEAHSYRPDGAFDLAAGAYLPHVVTSADGGRTWSAKRPLDVPFPNASPYGKIHVAADGAAALSIYEMPSNRVGLLWSRDNGKTWKHFTSLPGHDETQALSMPGDRWLALTRIEEPGKQGLLLSESLRGTSSWRESRRLLKAQQWPFDACLLKSGKLLVSYGMRLGPYGAGVLLCRDDGRTWDETRQVLIGSDSLNTDTGYPSTVPLDDGTIVTMYYAVGTRESADTQAIVVRYTERMIENALAGR